jgi:hypothetical protein
MSSLPALLKYRAIYTLQALFILLWKTDLRTQLAISELPVTHLIFLAGMDCDDCRQAGCHIVEVVRTEDRQWEYEMLGSPSLVPKQSERIILVSGADGS